MMIVCLLALHGKLLTREFLKTIGVTDSDYYVLCHSSPKSISHLFFEYQYSAYLWSLCRFKLGLPGLGTLKDEAILTQATFKEKTRSTILAKLILAVVTWHICKERNLRIFQLRKAIKLWSFANYMKT